MHYDVVYIIDDSELYCLTHQKLIQKLHSNTVIKRFSRPKHALVHLRKDLKQNLSVMVFLDIEMPAMNGLDVIRYIDRSDFLKIGKISVVLVSSAIKAYLHEDIMQSFLVKGKIQKPLTLKKLDGIIGEKTGANVLNVVA